MITSQIITQVQAMPKTHKVSVVQADGTVHEHPTHSRASAENYAAHMRFRFGATAQIEIIQL